MRGYSAGGEDFVQKFEKAYGKVEKPDFIYGTFEEVCEQARESRKPLLLLIQDTQGIIDKMFIRNTVGDPISLSILV